MFFYSAAITVIYVVWLRIDIVEGKDSPPLSPSDVTNDALIRRLRLLLSDRSSKQIPEQMLHGRKTANQARDELNTAVSSRGTSRDGAPDREISDIRPMSTHTGSCKATIGYVAVRDCPEGLRVDGTSCSGEAYERGAGRIPDKEPCQSELTDDGSNCKEAKDDIYEKGCCCTIFTKDCCNSCNDGYIDEGCYCRRSYFDIVIALSERQKCRSDEDKYHDRCYPKCKNGFHAVGCCTCQADGSSVKTPDECPGLKLTLSDRFYCTGDSINFLWFCMTIESCPLPDLVGRIYGLGVDMTAEQIEQLKKLLEAAGKLQN